MRKNTHGTTLPFFVRRSCFVAGVPRSVAMKLTGHKTESVYRRDAIADDRDLRVAVEKLDALATKYRVKGEG
jgi:hypothetical protein